MGIANSTEDEVQSIEIEKKNVTTNEIDDRLNKEVNELIVKLEKIDTTKNIKIIRGVEKTNRFRIEINEDDNQIQKSDLEVNTDSIQNFEKEHIKIKSGSDSIKNEIADDKVETVFDQINESCSKQSENLNKEISSTNNINNSNHEKNREKTHLIVDNTVENADSYHNISKEDIITKSESSLLDKNEFENDKVETVFDKINESYRIQSEILNKEITSIDNNDDIAKEKSEQNNEKEYTNINEINEIVNKESEKVIQTLPEIKLNNVSADEICSLLEDLQLVKKELFEVTKIYEEAKISFLSCENQRDHLSKENEELKNRLNAIQYMTKL